MDRDSQGKYIPKVPASELPAILQRISTGETLVSIAKEYGVHRVSLCNRFLRNMPEEYKQARIQQMQARINQCMAMFGKCDSRSTYERARKLLRREQYHAARLLPDHFPKFEFIHRRKVLSSLMEKGYWRVR